MSQAQAWTNALAAPIMAAAPPCFHRCLSPTFICVHLRRMTSRDISRPPWDAAGRRIARCKTLHNITTSLARDLRGLRA